MEKPHKKSFLVYKFNVKGKTYLYQWVDLKSFLQRRSKTKSWKEWKLETGKLKAKSQDVLSPIQVAFSFEFCEIFQNSFRALLNSSQRHC